jgi:hypothetical protein
LKDSDLTPGVDYCYKTRNSRYDDYAKKRGTYVRRLDPEPGKKRSRTHVLISGDREILIDASFILCRWDEYTKDPEYQAAFQRELKGVRDAQNKEAVKEWASLAAVIVGFRDTGVSMRYGSSTDTDLSLESQLLSRISVNMNGLELRDMIERLGLPCPPINLLTNESDLGSLIDDIVVPVSKTATP